MIKGVSQVAIWGAKTAVRVQVDPNRLSAHCTTVEYFGAVRRHIFQRLDGELLKYDQFGALAPRIAVGETATLGWQVEDSVLHVGAGTGAGTAA